MIDPTVVLLIWPVIALILIARNGMETGVIWVVVTGYLFLPDSFKVDLPGLPPYNKYTAVSFSLALAILFLAKRGEEERPVYTDKLVARIFMALAIVLLLSPVFTMLDNRNVIVTGPTVRSALSFRDVIAMTSDMLIVLVPYYVGRRWVSTPEQHTRLLVAILIMGLIYSLLVLFEARMSPQLNRWTYGYFPHSWRQHFRGGFRPVVFLRHGLWVGFFLLTVILAAFALARQQKQGKMLYILAGLWMMGVLVISRNLGATMLAVVFAPLVLLLTPRMQARIAAVVAIIFLAMPALRQAEILRFDGFVELVAKSRPDRAASLQYRLDNEDALLERALEKPYFGWGGWARQLIYDERGRNQSVTDGLWIIVIGERGWVGYIAFFGLIIYPLLLLGRAARRKQLEPATAGLAILTAVNLIYVVPNSTMSSIAWLVFGALAGYVQKDYRKAGEPDPDGESRPADGDRTVRYTRFAPGQGGGALQFKLSGEGREISQRSTGSIPY